MLNKTLKLREKLLQFEDAKDRIKCLKDAYKDETAYIVAGGPSLNNYTSEYLNEFFKDKLTLPIKQSWNMLREVADFHLLNFCNFAEYNWSGNKSIITWAIFEQFHPEMIFKNNLECDLMIPIYRNNQFTGGGEGPNKMIYSLAERGDWDTMLLDGDINQPWGPGIMYEMAIPLSLYLGCKKIVTVGWDIGDIKSFDNGPDDDTQRVFQDHFYGNEHNKIVYAKTSMGPREITSVAKSTKSLFYWLKDRGVDWKIVSDRNPGYDKIERINI